MFVKWPEILLPKSLDTMILKQWMLIPKPLLCACLASSSAWFVVRSWFLDRGRVLKFKEEGRRFGVGSWFVGCQSILEMSAIGRHRKEQLSRVSWSCHESERRSGGRLHVVRRKMRRVRLIWRWRDDRAPRQKMLVWLSSLERKTEKWLAKKEPVGRRNSLLVVCKCLTKRNPGKPSAPWRQPNEHNKSTTKASKNRERFTRNNRELERSSRTPKNTSTNHGTLSTKQRSKKNLIDNIIAWDLKGAGQVHKYTDRRTHLK